MELSTSSQIVFSTATISDAKEIADLVNSGYRGDVSRTGWTTEADLLDGQRTDAQKIQAMVEEEDSVLLLARTSPKGKIIACVYLHRESAVTGYLGMLTVDPTLQAGGVGKSMMTESEKIVKAWGCIQLRMVVLRQRAELIAYYERRGYRKTGVSEPFDVTDPRFSGQPKVADLHLDELVKLLP